MAVIESELKNINNLQQSKAGHRFLFKKEVWSTTLARRVGIEVVPSFSSLFSDVVLYLASRGLDVIITAVRGSIPS